MKVYKIGIAALAALAALGGCCKPHYVYDCPASDSPTELKAGESRKVRVQLKEKCNLSGIKVQKGGDYEFTVVAGDGPIWDGPLKCLRWEYKSDAGCRPEERIGAEGFTTEKLPWYTRLIFWSVKSSRPVPGGRWLETVGTVGREDREFFRVLAHGAGQPYRAPEDGELFFLSNDDPHDGHYRNNTGEVTVTVTAVPEPASR